MARMGHAHMEQANRIDSEVGYGLPVGSRFVGTRIGFSTSEYRRNYRVGYNLEVLDRRALDFMLGLDAERCESPTLNGGDNGVAGRTTLGW